MLAAHPSYFVQCAVQFLTNSWFHCLVRPGFDRLVNAGRAPRLDSHAYWTSCFHGYLYGLSF
jgi:hypothetical protein